MLGIGLLGCGTVGSAFASLIADRADLEIRRVAVRDLSKPRPSVLDPTIVTDDAASVVESDDIDIVVELIGGLEPAGTLVATALKHGKSVVTGNKELIAARGAELLAIADGAGVDLLFEAAVAGAIPVVRALRTSLAGERIERIVGIVNGTTNFILSKMEAEGSSYDDVLAEAQRLGYAEADPAADVEGHDAAAKMAIMASIAFDAIVPADDVYREGITAISDDDIEYARRLGYRIRLLGIADPTSGTPTSSVGVRVHPAMVPEHHPLASVFDSFNAVFVEGAACGQLMLYGRGAGGAPTASAVMGDVLDAASARRSGGHRRFVLERDITVTPVEELVSAFCIHVEVKDAPGVLARLAGAFGDNGVSIRVMEQHDLEADDDGTDEAGSDSFARIILITHEAPEHKLRATLDAFDDLGVVRRVRSVIRVLS